MIAKGKQKDRRSSCGFEALETRTLMSAAPLAAPTGFTAHIAGTSIDLAWTDNTSSATGYHILRSTDGVNYVLLTNATGATADTYTQPYPTYGEKYYYKVEAYNGVTTSAATAAASVTTPGAAVTVTTRYGDELVITANGVDDLISILQNGSTLTIKADQHTYTATAGGLFVYTRGGTDTIDIAGSVTADTTVETIDAAVTTITSYGTDVTAWIDANDSFTGTGSVHRVANFAGGVSKATGASLANPSDAGTTVRVNASLFGTGPVIGDVNQGEVGDCYFLASLAAFAKQDPNLLVQSAVDMGDGTYTVQFKEGGTSEFVRVNNYFSAGPFNGLLYAHPGTDGSIWAMVFEKAFAYFRTGANTYNSINSGWMGNVYSDFGIASTAFWPSYYTATSLYNLLARDLASGQEITLGTDSNAPNLVSDHAYTLVNAYKDAQGVIHFVVRNPWGVQGDALENSSGYAVLTYAQLVANFEDGCISA